MNSETPGTSPFDVDARRRVVSLLAVALALYLVAPLVMARAGAWLAPRSSGLQARYFSLSGEPLGTAAESVIERRRAEGPSEYRAVWEGWLVVKDAGVHRFWTHTTGPALLWIDGRLVVDNGGQHRRQVRSGETALAAGTYPIRIDYTHFGTPRFLFVAWALPTGEVRFLETPMTDLQPQRPSLFERLGLAWRGNGAISATATYAVAALALVVWLVVCLPLRRITIRCGYPLPPALWAILAGTFVLLTWSIDWGLPARWSRAPDELLPVDDVLAGLAMGFSGGWSSTYPPLHFYILSPLAAVLPLVKSLGLTAAYSVEMIGTVHVAMRLVSVAMTLGTAVVVFWLGVELFGRHRAILTPVVFVLSLQVVYYAKVTNVDMPSVFWLSLSLLFFVRLLRTVTTVDAVWLGTTVAAATATKDMVGGYFILIPVALLAREYLARRRSATPASMLAVGTDRRFLCGAGACALTLLVLFNPALNWNGVSEHFESLLQLSWVARPAPTSGGPVPTLAEQQQNWRHVPRQAGLDLLVPLIWYAGWPGLLVVLLGLGWAIARPDRRGLLWLLVPPLSYYVCILSPLGRPDDRYLLGVWLIGSVFGGALLGDVVTTVRAPRLARGLVVGGLVAHGVLYANTTNVMMSRDARSLSETFIRATISPFHGIGLVGILQYLPQVDGFACIPLAPTAHALLTHHPPYVAVNLDHLSRYARDATISSFTRRLLKGDEGYTPIFDARSTLPWWSFARTIDVLRHEGGSPFTNLDKVNPRIIILEHVAATN